MKLRTWTPNYHDTMPFVIDRPTYFDRVETALKRSPVTALLGPRQAGKTTLSRMLSKPKPLVRFDLEDEADRSRLANPALTLGPRQPVGTGWGGGLPLRVATTAGVALPGAPPGLPRRPGGWDYDLRAHKNHSNAGMGVRRGLGHPCRGLVVGGPGGLR